MISKIKKNKKKKMEIKRKFILPSFMVGKLIFIEENAYSQETHFFF